MELEARDVWEIQEDLSGEITYGQLRVPPCKASNPKLHLKECITYTEPQEN